MKPIIVLGIIIAIVICVSPARAENLAQPTPRRLSDTSSAMSKPPSLAERTSIDLRRDGDTYKDKKTGEKYKVTEVGSTLTIKNLQTGEKVDYRVSGQNLTNKTTGQKFRIRRDGTNITITKKD